jgi:GNAT superfamily N-acetyltransferase
MDTIRPLERSDWEAWLPLWHGYLDFYRSTLSEATTEATFSRLCTESEAMFGFLALDETGAGRGLVHCVLHASTWSRRPSCYLEDLFVGPDARGSGLGRALIERARRSADDRGAHHLYWHTQQYNGRARSLYDQVARPTSFMVYETDVTPIS